MHLKEQLTLRVRGEILHLKEQLTRRVRGKILHFKVQLTIKCLGWRAKSLLGVNYISRNAIAHDCKTWVWQYWIIWIAKVPCMCNSEHNRTQQWLFNFWSWIDCQHWTLEGWLPQFVFAFKWACWLAIRWNKPIFSYEKMKRLCHWTHYVSCDNLHECTCI